MPGSVFFFNQCQVVITRFLVASCPSIADMSPSLCYFIITPIRKKSVFLQLPAEKGMGFYLNRSS